MNSTDRSGYSLGGHNTTNPLFDTTSHNPLTSHPSLAPHQAMTSHNTLTSHNVAMTSHDTSSAHARSGAYTNMSSQPLMALHNMADGMKAPAGGGGTGVFSPAPQYNQNANAYNSIKNLSPTSNSMLGTPHGISDILRASMAAGLNPLGLNSLNTNMHIANYLNSSSSSSSPANRYPKPMTELPGRSPVYWPSGMLNPAWRGAQGKIILYYSLSLYFDFTSERQWNRYMVGLWLEIIDASQLTTLGPAQFNTML